MFSPESMYYGRILEQAIICYDWKVAAHSKPLQSADPISIFCVKFEFYGI